MSVIASKELDDWFGFGCYLASCDESCRELVMKHYRLICCVLMRYDIVHVPNRLLFTFPLNHVLLALYVYQCILFIVNYCNFSDWRELLRIISITHFDRSFLSLFFFFSFCAFFIDNLCHEIDNLCMPVMFSVIRTLI
jgi:hypothetical protein